MGRHEALVMGRRRALQIGGGLLGGAVANRVLGAAERLVDPQRASIEVVGGDQLLDTTSAVVGVAGQFLRSAAAPLAALPILKEKFGTRLDAKFGSTNVGISDLERGLIQKQEETDGNLITLSWAVLSDGIEPTAELIPLLGNNFDTRVVMLFGSPAGLANAKGFVGAFARLYKNVDIGDNPLLTALSDSQIFHQRHFSLDPTAQFMQSFLDPFMFDDVSPPALAEDQYQRLVHSAPAIHKYARYVGRYNRAHAEHPIKHIYFLTNKDTYVDDIGALSMLNAIIPGIIAAPVGGPNQGHANPVQNPEGYTQALEKVFAKYKI